MGLLTDFQLDYSFIDDIDSQVAAIIVAAGASTRMKENKQFIPLLGVPVLARSVMAFESCQLVRDIVIVGQEEDLADIQKLCDRYEFAKVTALVAGGETRRQSVEAGVRSCNPDIRYFAIHDGARPLVTDTEIRSVITRAEECGAAAVGVRVKDTVKRVNVEHKIVETPKREFLYFVQTPQVFDAEIYKKAMTNAKDCTEDFTDDCSICEYAGFDVFMVEGSYENIKITTLEDIEIAEAILSRRQA